jgi:Helix-turn-helix domain
MTADREREFREVAFRKYECRRQTKGLIERGQLVRQPCDTCGSAKVQAHHTDYKDPRHVRWLCHLCHHRLHRQLRRTDRLVTTLTSAHHMTNAAHSTWLTKARAASTIGVTTKTIERLAREGHLRQARWQRPTGGPALVVYHPDDVAKVAAERPPRRVSGIVVPAGDAPFQTPRSVVIPPNGNGNGHGDPSALAIPAPALPPTEDLFRLLVTAAQRVMSEKTSQTPALFVTLAEASAVTGLSQAYLKRLIEAKILPAVRDVGWRIRRKDLEQL